MLHFRLQNFALRNRILINTLMSSTDGLESMEDCLLRLHIINRINDLTKNSSKSSMFFKIINKIVTNVTLISERNLFSLRKSTLRYAYAVPYHEYVLFSAKNDVRYVTYAACSKPIILKCTKRPSLLNGMQTRLYEYAMPITTKVPRMKVIYVNILRIFNYLHIVFSVNTSYYSRI